MTRLDYCELWRVLLSKTGNGKISSAADFFMQMLDTVTAVQRVQRRQIRKSDRPTSTSQVKTGTNYFYHGTRYCLHTCALDSRALNNDPKIIRAYFQSRRPEGSD